jgi:hypothetical protein
MVDVGATGSHAAGQRTFDCPWCGAISSIPADHLGEHFTCPECHKATKVTEKNTSSLPPTAPPPDAPHLSGDRTFDCPWCGAISSIPSSHLGEHFTCPECHKATKLTEKNTTRRPPTEAPAGAPHEEKVGGRGVLVVLALALVGAGLWLALGRGRGGEPEQVDTIVSSPPPSTGLPPGPAPTPTPTPAVPSTPPPGPTAGPPTPLPPPRAEGEAVERARARVTDASARLSVAQARLTAARSRLSGYSDEAAEAARGNLAALRQVASESAAQREKLGPDATPEQARAHDLAMVLFVDGSPARVRVAEAALALLRKDLYGREVAGAASWRETSFFGPGFRRALATLEAEWAGAAKPAPPEVRDEEAKAAKAVEDARREHADAEAALRTLLGPPK